MWLIELLFCALQIWNVLHAATPATAKEHDIVQQGQLFHMLADYVAFPSISSDPLYREDCRRCAHFLQKSCAALGAEADLVRVDAALFSHPSAE